MTFLLYAKRQTHTHQLFAEIARHDFAELSGSSPSQMFISLSCRLIIIIFVLICIIFAYLSIVVQNYIFKQIS